MPWLVAVVAVTVVSGVYYLWFSPSSQLFGRFPFHLNTTEKIVALTFDDGPNPPYTNALLEVLRKHDVQATFFVVGKNLEKYPDVGRAIVADGHTIGNHTYAHDFSNYLKHLTLDRDIERNQDLIARLLGQRPMFFRPPWLFRQPWLLRHIRKLGLTPVSGVFGSEREIFQPPAATMVNRALQKIHPGTILIFHDGYNASGGNRQETVAAIDLLIPQVKALGYTFVTLAALPERPTPA